MKLLLLFFVTLSFLNLSAQWNPDTTVNTLVADSEGGDMKAAGTSDGKTYVVFWKSVPGPTNYELRMQLLDVAGNKVLGSDGILISNTIPMSTFTVLWSISVDDDDNLFIGVTGTGGGDPAFVFKMDASGNHLWGPNGVNVGTGNIVTVLPLASGEAIVSWYPGGQSLMRKYSSNGTAVWPAAKPVVSGASATIPANMFEISSGNYILIFHIPLAGINSNVYAQRFDTDGNAVWGSTTQLSNQATAFNRSYSVAQDGDVIYFGYFGSTGVRFDSFLQRLNSDGSLPWGINGSDFDTNQTNYEMTTSIAFDPASQFLWAVCNYSNTSQSEHGTYVQKFDKESGARQFTDNAKELYAISNLDQVHAGKLQLIDDDPLFLLKSGFDNGVSPTVLGAVYLDENGDFFWPEMSRPVATFTANKSRIHFTRNVNHQSVAVFIEEKAAQPNIYAQNFITEPILNVPAFSEARQFSYINPVSDVFLLKSEDPIEFVRIFDLLGHEVYASGAISSREISLNTASWKTGMYFAHIKLGKQQFKHIKVLKL